ncbi:MAG: PDZ domain-containing protein [Candidatus Nanopelagicaceae bacterium]|nr:PDZ domain-containing protein [Candidatus Nanopelagicaceae bacterium]
MKSISPLRYRWPFPAKLFFYLLTIATLLAPIPFVFFKPGVPDNVAAGIIELNDVKTYPVNGKLYITSILVTNPDSPVFGAETIVNWALGPHVVLPRDTVYPPIQPAQQINRDSRSEMRSSQATATAAALRYLGYEFQELYYVSDIRDYSNAIDQLKVGDFIMEIDGKKITEIEEIRTSYQDKKVGDSLLISVDRENKSGDIERKSFKVELVENQELNASTGEKKPAIGILVGTTARFPIDVDFNISGVGGPSAGLIFAVGIIEKLTQEDLLRGRNVAGTGAITASGRVGGIGGIEEKMIGASRIGATVFLAPTENCPDIKHIPKGLKVIPVSTLAEAVDALRAPDNFKHPTCPNW